MTNNRKIRVFLSAPYTDPDPVANTNRAISETIWLIDNGFTVFCPHLSLFLHLLHPREKQYWLDHDLEWLRACGCVRRLGGVSPGGDGEEQEANKLGIPVFNTRQELLEWIEATA